MSEYFSPPFLTNNDEQKEKAMRARKVATDDLTRGEDIARERMSVASILSLFAPAVWPRWVYR